MVRGPAGVRAQAVAADGTLVDDFQVHFLGSIVAVRNALTLRGHVVARHCRAPGWPLGGGKFHLNGRP